MQEADPSPMSLTRPGVAAQDEARLLPEPTVALHLTHRSQPYRLIT